MKIHRSGIARVQTARSVRIQGNGLQCAVWVRGGLLWCAGNRKKYRFRAWDRRWPDVTTSNCRCIPRDRHTEYSSTYIRPQYYVCTFTARMSNIEAVCFHARSDSTPLHPPLGWGWGGQFNNVTTINAGWNEHRRTTVSTADRKNPFQMHERPKYIILSAAVGKWWLIVSYRIIQKCVWPPSSLCSLYGEPFGGLIRSHPSHHHWDIWLRITMTVKNSSEIVPGTDNQVPRNPRGSIRGFILT